MPDTLLLFTGDEDHDLLDSKREVVLPVAELQANLRRFVDGLEDIIPPQQAEPTKKGLALKTVAVAVGVNAKGQVGFLGTGAEVGGNATLTLTFEIKA